MYSTQWGIKLVTISIIHHIKAPGEGSEVFSRFYGSGTSKVLHNVLLIDPEVERKKI